MWPVKASDITENEKRLLGVIDAPNIKVFEKPDGIVTVKLNDTVIAEWDPAANTVQIYSGNFATPTTTIGVINDVLETLNLESSVGFEGGDWVIYAPALEPVAFEEGFTVTARKVVAEGRGLGEPEDGKCPITGEPVEHKGQKGEKEREGKGLKVDDDTDAQLKKGVEMEKEHDDAYDFMKQIYEDTGEFPSVEEFREKIAMVHIGENEKYYDLLEDMEASFKAEAASQEKTIEEVTEDGDAIKEKMDKALEVFQKDPTEATKSDLASLEGQLLRVANTLRKMRADNAATAKKVVADSSTDFSANYDRYKAEMGEDVSDSQKSGKEIKLTYLEDDEDGQKTYKGDNGKLYVGIMENGIGEVITELYDGEPFVPVRNVVMATTAKKVKASDPVKEKELRNIYEAAREKREAFTGDETSPDYIALNKDFDEKIHSYMSYMFPRDAQAKRVKASNDTEVSGYVDFDVDGVSTEFPYSGRTFSDGDERAPQEDIDIEQPDGVSDDLFSSIYDDVMEKVLSDIYDKNKVKASIPKIYDSGKRSIKDRYTVVIGKDAYAMSHNASDPNGMDIWLGVKASLDSSTFGKRVSRRSVKASVQKAITKRLSAYKK